MSKIMWYELTVYEVRELMTYGNVDSVDSRKF